MRTSCSTAPSIPLFLLMCVYYDSKGLCELNFGETTIVFFSKVSEGSSNNFEEIFARFLAKDILKKALEILTKIEFPMPLIFIF